MSKRGLYEKYLVQRTDGQDASGEKHAGCEYFILDLWHDPHSLPALGAYIESVAHDEPRLASDLRRKLGMWRAKQMAEGVRLATPGDEAKADGRAAEAEH